MNNIQRTEAAIKDGNLGEPVLRFRVYSMTSSPAHLAAGADWQLCMSAHTKEAAQEMMDNHYLRDLDFFSIVDGEAS